MCKICNIIYLISNFLITKIIHRTYFKQVRVIDEIWQEKLNMIEAANKLIITLNEIDKLMEDNPCPMKNLMKEP
jgi:hypothetical protein